MGFYFSSHGYLINKLKESRFVFADIGIIFANFYRHVNLCMTIHSLCFYITDFLTILMTIIQFSLGGDSEDPLLKPHAVLALLLTSKMFLSTKSYCNWLINRRNDSEIFSLG
jgi:hypothetical protein